MSTTTTQTTRTQPRQSLWLVGLCRAFGHRGSVWCRDCGVCLVGGEVLR